MTEYKDLEPKRYNIENVLVGSNGKLLRITLSQKETDDEIEVYVDKDSMKNWMKKVDRAIAKTKLVEIDS